MYTKLITTENLKYTYMFFESIQILCKSHRFFDLICHLLSEANNRICEKCTYYHGRHCFWKLRLVREFYIRYNLYFSKN